MYARATSWIVLVTFAGCNQVFGLTDTAPLDASVSGDAPVVDRDLDGVLDVIDNCPDVYNQLQENQDQDAFGDACDACVEGANSDEDGDLLLDGCDNCPHLVNASQENVDGDALGDACDPDNAIQNRRAAFDGFAEPLSLLWIPEVAEWESADGTAHAKTQPPAFETGMWSRFIEVIGVSWQIETAVTIDDALTAQHAGLYTRTRSGAHDHACYLSRATSTWTLQMSVADPANPMTPFTAMMDLPSLPPLPVRLRLRLQGSSIVCDIPGIATLTLGSNDTRTGVGLFVSSTSARFHYVDAIGSQ